MLYSIRTIKSTAYGLRNAAIFEIMLKFNKLNTINIYSFIESILNRLNILLCPVIHVQYYILNSIRLSVISFSFRFSHGKAP